MVLVPKDAEGDPAVKVSLLLSPPRCQFFFGHLRKRLGWKLLEEAIRFSGPNDSS